MHTIIVCVVAVALPIRFPMGAVVAPPDLLDMRRDVEPAPVPKTVPKPVPKPVGEPEVERPVVGPRAAEVPIVEPPVEVAVVEPVPIEAEVPAPVVEPAAPTAVEEASTLPVPPPVLEPHVVSNTVSRARRTRDVGVGIMIASGSVMVGGVILILAGAGVAARAAKNSGCEAEECAADPGYQTGARVTAAGLIFSTLSAVGFVAGLVTYGVGRSRLQRAHAGSMLVIAPTRSGGAVGVRGQF